MCSFQTSTGTLLMFLVVEKIGAATVDEEDEVVLVFWRLTGGAVAALLVPVVVSVSLADIFNGAVEGLKTSCWPPPPRKSVNQKFHTPKH
jgi:hypothetical protein